jgi:phosphosulfolactate synthase
MLDIAKFGIGTAYLTQRLDEKIALYRDHGVEPYFGGTLFEKFYHQRKVAAYAKYLRKHRIEWIEISNGTDRSAARQAGETRGATPR